MLVLVLLMVMMGLLVALGVAAGARGTDDGERAAPAAPEQVTLRVNLGEGPLELDPARADDAASVLAVEQLFIGLIDLEDETGQIRPELATTWTVSADHTVYTFTLRNDADWSDGNPITAGDVEYGILYALDPTNPSYYAGVLAEFIENGEDYYDGVITDPSLVGVKALNPTTLRIRTAEPGAAKLTLLSMWMARPLPQWAVEAPGVVTWTLPSNIVTSGPYRLTQWDDVHLVMEKNPTYYDAAAVQIERIEAARVDENTAVGMYLDGALDTVQVPDDYPLWIGLMPQVHTVPSQASYYNGFSVDLAPFDDERVRQAFAAAVDRQAMLDDVYSGSALAALTFTPPTVFGYVDGAAEGVGIPYNPAQAQTWLAQAGYPGGASIPPITYTVYSNTRAVALAEYMVDSWWSNLNVSVTLRVLPFPVMWTVCASGCQIWTVGWGPDYNDAYSFLHDAVGSHRARLGNWTDPSYESLLAAATMEEDPDARRALYRDAEEILVETEVPLVPLYHRAYRVATKPYLHRTYSQWPVDMANWWIGREVYLPTVLRDYAPLTNGGFEDGWAGWSHGGGLPQAIISNDGWSGPHSGSYAARLGDWSGNCEGGVPVGSAWVERVISVPPGDATHLRIYYRIVSEDQFVGSLYDRFEIWLNGTRLFMDGDAEPQGCVSGPKIGDWEFYDVPVGDHLGENVTLRLVNWSADPWFRTWTYVDDIELVPSAVDEQGPVIVVDGCVSDEIAATIGTVEPHSGGE